MMAVMDWHPEEIERYSRQVLLDEVGLEGQETLRNSKVLLIGAGGLGSPAALYLAGAGVGVLGLVDHDVVDRSNLQRQVLHGSSVLGKAKVASAKARLEDLNPFVEVRGHEVALDEDNALDLMRGYDLVIDGSDNHPTRYLVNDACVLLGIPLVYGAVFRFDGQASLFNHEGGPDYRDLFPEPPPPELAPSCSEAGVLGVLPGLVGLIQATEALKVLLGRGETLSGRLLSYNALAMTFQEYRIRRRPDRAPITRLTTYAQACASPADQAPPYGEITPVESRSRLDGGWKPYVLDVRNPQEAAIVSLAFADQLCPETELDSIVATLPRDRDILVHCKTGGRSARACRRLVEQGFETEHVFDMKGGILGWVRDVDPSLTAY